MTTFLWIKQRWLYQNLGRFKLNGRQVGHVSNCPSTDIFHKFILPILFNESHLTFLNPENTEVWFYMFKLCVEATVVILVYLLCSKERLSGVNCKTGSKCSSHCLPCCHLCAHGNGKCCSLSLFGFPKSKVSLNLLCSPPPLTLKFKIQ